MNSMLVPWSNSIFDCILDTVRAADMIGQVKTRYFSLFSAQIVCNSQGGKPLSSWDQRDLFLRLSGLFMFSEEVRCFWTCQTEGNVSFHHAATSEWCFSKI